MDRPDRRVPCICAAHPISVPHPRARKRRWPVCRRR